tara:strand:- start:712 stop:1263 length:552 start_codon:yes stop_codon:yes gene_type:complete
MIQIQLKKQIRDNLLKRRLKLTEDEVSRLSKQINENIQSQDVYRKSLNIGTYISIKNEPIIERQKDKIYSCPKVMGTEINFFKIQNNFKKGAFDIPEPTNDVPFDIFDLDLLLIPLVAFNKKLERIGYGKGFYDKFLAKFNENDRRPYFWGIGYNFQIVDEIFGEKLDIKLDKVITERNIYEK